jgi:hypothetical protein
MSTAVQYTGAPENFDLTPYLTYVYGKGRLWVCMVADFVTVLLKGREGKEVENER